MIKRMIIITTIALILLIGAILFNYDFFHSLAILAFIFAIDNQIIEANRYMREKALEDIIKKQLEDNDE